jgi:hypothetical protein
MNLNSATLASEAGLESGAPPDTPSAGNPRTAAQGGIFLRVITRVYSLWGAHQLYIFPIIPRIANIGGTMKLITEQRQSRMSWLSRLLAYIYIEITIEETCFAQQVRKPAQLLFDSILHLIPSRKADN